MILYFKENSKEFQKIDSTWSENWDQSLLLKVTHELKSVQQECWLFHTNTYLFLK